MLVYIPIKKNSQRVPGKNFREFRGKPLWEHTVDKLGKFDVYVDTDSEQIVEECEDKSWVTPHIRRDRLRGDTISVVDLLKDFRDLMEISYHDVIAQIHCTSPFLHPAHISMARGMIEVGKHDSVFSADVVQNRLWREEPYGQCPVNHNPMKLEQTQDLPKFYMENSYLYMFRAGVLDGGNRIGKNPGVLEVGFPYNLDIDTEDDWEMINKVSH